MLSDIRHDYCGNTGWLRDSVEILIICSTTNHHPSMAGTPHYQNCFAFSTKMPPYVIMSGKPRARFPSGYVNMTVLSQHLAIQERILSRPHPWPYRLRRRLQRQISVFPGCCTEELLDQTSEWRRLRGGSQFFSEAQTGIVSLWQVTVYYWKVTPSKKHLTTVYSRATFLWNLLFLFRFVIDFKLQHYHRRSQGLVEVQRFYFIRFHMWKSRGSAIQNAHTFAKDSNFITNYYHLRVIRSVLRNPSAGDVTHRAASQSVSSHTCAPKVALSPKLTSACTVSLPSDIRTSLPLPGQDRHLSSCSRCSCTL